MRTPREARYRIAQARNRGQQRGKRVDKSATNGPLPDGSRPIVARVVAHVLHFLYSTWVGLTC